MGLCESGLVKEHITYVAVERRPTVGVVAADVDVVRVVRITAPGGGVVRVDRSPVAIGTTRHDLHAIGIDNVGPVRLDHQTQDGFLSVGQGRTPITPIISGYHHPAIGMTHRQRKAIIEDVHNFATGFTAHGGIGRLYGGNNGDSVRDDGRGVAPLPIAGIAGIEVLLPFDATDRFHSGSTDRGERLTGWHQGRPIAGCTAGGQAAGDDREQELIRRRNLARAGNEHRGNRVTGNHRVEGVAGRGTDIHAVHEHAGDGIVRVRCDGEGLVAAVVHIHRAAGADGATGGCGCRDGNDPHGERGGDRVRGLHIVERVAGDRALGHTVHEHPGHLIAGIRIDIERLVGAGAHHLRAGRADRTVGARGSRDRVDGHACERRRDGVVCGHAVESVTGNGALVHSVHAQLGNRVTEVGLGDEGRASSIGNTHTASRADGATGSGGCRDCAGCDDAELAGHARFESQAIGIAQGGIVDEEIADVAVVCGPCGGVIAADVDVGGIGCRDARYQRNHRAGRGGRVHLGAIGEHLECTVRLAHQAQHRELVAGNDRAGGIGGAIAQHDDLPGIVFHSQHKAIGEDIDNRVIRITRGVAQWFDDHHDAGPIAWNGSGQVITAIVAIAVGTQVVIPLRVVSGDHGRRHHRRVGLARRQITRPIAGCPAGREGFGKRGGDQT